MTDDLERELAAALRAEAERTMPAGDGLAKIRTRTSRPAGALSWFSRPALAGGTLVIALVAGTLIGLQLTRDPGTTVVEPPRQPIVVLPNASTGPLPSAEPTPMPVLTDPGSSSAPKSSPSLDPSTYGVGGDAPGLNFTPGPVTPANEERRNYNGIPEDTGGNYVGIFSPLSGTAVPPGQVALSGKARVFEATITVDVSQNGKVLQTKHVTASAGAPELGDWSTVFTLADGNYRIDAYALSPADGETRLASDSIWITVSAAPSEPAAPTPATTSPGTAEVPGTEPQG